MNEIVGNTNSGDRYTGTQEAWDRYRQAWRDNNIDLVMFMEEGDDPDFWYSP